MHIYIIREILIKVKVLNDAGFILTEIQGLKVFR